MTLTELVEIPGGVFTMGSETVAADGLVAETGYVTVAERGPDPAELPGIDSALLVAGSLVFTPTDWPVPLDDWSRWWRFRPGVSWRHPQEWGSSLDGLGGSWT